MKELFNQHRISLKGVAPRDIKQIALRSHHLAILAEEDLLTLSILDHRIATVVFSHRLNWEPSAMELSPSQRYLMLYSKTGDHIRIWDLTSKCLVTSIDAEDTKSVPLTATFIMWNSRELLLLSKKLFVLEGYLLEDMSKVILFDTKSSAPFIFSSLYSLKRGDMFSALGHYFSEGKDSLIILSLSKLVDDERAAAREFKLREGITDYAYRLAVGSCKEDQVVIFRDPEDDEVLDEDDEPEAMGDVENFRGLYIRSLLSGKLIERIEYDAPIRTGAPLLATDVGVAVVCPGQLEIIPRNKVRAEIALIPGRAFSLDPVCSQVALITHESNIEIVELSLTLDSNK